MSLQVRDRLRAMRAWSAPPDWHRLTTIDAHTAGEPLRIIVEGFPEIPGETMLEKRRYAKEHLDTVRTALMWEPRGHADMYGCVFTPPVSAGADFGVLFLHNEGYSTMCGHGIIALTKVAVETGLVLMKKPTTEIGIDSPAGLISAKAHIIDDEVASVSFLNVPSFVVALDEAVNVPGIGEVIYDLAFGGAFYAFVDINEVGLEGKPSDFQALIQKGMAIKRAIMKQRPIDHPLEQDLGFLYGVIFVGPSTKDGVHSKHICVFADGEVDRSPTGTGVSARLAILYARKVVKANEEIAIESIIGTQFKGRVHGLATIRNLPAVIPEVRGTAYITGTHTFLIEPDDPLSGGFILR